MLWTEKDGNGTWLVGRATVFVSHAWGQSVIETLTVLEHAECHPDHRYWIDLCCFNQHQASAALAGKVDIDWIKWFENIIGGCGRLLIVTAPRRRHTFVVSCRGGQGQGSRA
eukprot:m.470673 g.470673  ORF g.470673 m.470673 type:complete len:112 (-) comp30101_c0_seq1:1631-1966(-)